jgi:hypothetical protein
MRIIVGVVRPVLFAVVICLVVLSTHAASAAEFRPELTCPSCEDHNACTVDSCDPVTGTCRHDPLDCNDGNACTTDTCVRQVNGGCRHSFLASGSACNDGDACTAADACDGSGHCAGQLQSAGSACDDGNPCTAGDVCGAGGTCSGTPLAAGAECDDRNACTLGERCGAGTDGSIACQAPGRNCDDGLRCTTDSCDPITGDCVHAPIDCDDHNPCTLDGCDEATGACTRTVRTGSCDDNDICTVNDACVDGNCLGGGAWDCGWHCGIAFCIPDDQNCFTSPTPSGCPAPGECIHYECRNGSCISVNNPSTQSCNGGNQCVRGSCTRGICQGAPAPVGTPCDDGSLCTSGDSCQGALCTGTPVCGDGDACTDDLCDAASGACLGHQPKNCDDGNPCTTDSCDPAAGCRHTLTTDACDDQDACTVNDRCDNGQCRGTFAVSCTDDGNPCTDDLCDRTTGACIHPNNFVPCSDGNPCTFGDSCRDGTCHSGTPNPCNDSNVCTADACDPATGACLHAPADGPCNDGNACTVADTCVAGACRPGPPPNCDDGNTCTTDGCDTFSGCYHIVRAGACDDGNPCTTGDACVNGVCRPNAPVSCIDGNTCTIDHCDRSTGACVHTPAGVDCDDHDACTIDRCDTANGTCLGHVPVDCDDGNACTTDACDPATGCTHVLTCRQEVVDIRISFVNPAGRGAGILTWRTTGEITLAGFNILVIDQQGLAEQINPALVPCTQCVTGSGASYSYTVPKHKSAQGLFVETIGSDGSVLGRFGPAEKIPKGPGSGAPSQSPPM